MEWKDIAELYPEFVQWIIQKHGPLPEGEVKEEDYERYRENTVQVIEYEFG